MTVPFTSSGGSGAATETPQFGATFVRGVNGCRLQNGTAEGLILALPAATAIDVFVIYHTPGQQPTTTLDAGEGGSTNFALFGSTSIGAFDVAEFSAARTDVLPSNGRIFCIRDFPASTWELRGGMLGTDDVIFVDVVAIGWAREPTGIGPWAMTTFQHGDLVADIIAGPLLMGIGTDKTVRALAFSDWDPTSVDLDPYAVLATSPQVYNEATKLRSAMLGDGSGNLLVALGSAGVALDPLRQPTRTATVTKSDVTDLTTTATKGLWVGTAGDLTVKLAGDSGSTVLKNVASGTYVPGSFQKVMLATTATDIVSFYGP